MRSRGTREGQDDSLTNSDFYEIGYDCEGGDNDLFAQNVNVVLNENNEQQEDIIQKGDPLDDDDLNLSREELEKLQCVFRAFNPELDSSNPIFMLRIVFG